VLHSRPEVTESARVPTRERLLELIDRMAGRPVVVLADLVADRFIVGTAKRISREAPVLILRQESERLLPGGGANAVANVAALGGRPVALGLVGDDESGRALVNDLAQRGADVTGIVVRAGYRTPTKTRILGGAKGGVKQQIVRFDIEDPVTPTASDRDRFLAATRASGAAVAILSDYGYGSVEPEFAAALRTALPAGAVLVCDSRYRLAEFVGVDGATPNEEEAENLWGGDLDPGGIHATGEALRTRLGARFLLVTRGSRGLALFAEGRPSAHLPVHGTDQVADVTGAGDTVIGTFALALAAGSSPLEAAVLANYAGGIVVMKLGTATLSPDELREAVRADSRPLEELSWAVS
jgi:D-glycero-beta-D-manno-heptose-7-phosphate kinase